MLCCISSNSRLYCFTLVHVALAKTTAYWEIYISVEKKNFQWAERGSSESLPAIKQRRKENYGGHVYLHTLKHNLHLYHTIRTKVKERGKHFHLLSMCYPRSFSGRSWPMEEWMNNLVCRRTANIPSSTSTLKHSFGTGCSCLVVEIFTR